MKRFLTLLTAFIICFGVIIWRVFVSKNVCYAADTNKKYYTIYADNKKEKVLFLKGDEVNVGDEYLSHDNKFYQIESVDQKINLR